MNLEWTLISSKTNELSEFRAPKTMTTAELGDTLARLVWESFSDFLSREDMGTPLPRGAFMADDEVTPDDHAAEEALIFFMWAHTRGAQLAFRGRIPEATIRRGLDALHRAVFEDMVLHGTPRSQLPLFEQRVSARYAEYYRAAAHSDTRLGQAVCRHLTGPPADCRELAEAITERAVAVAHPLRDFLEDVTLLD